MTTIDPFDITAKTKIGRAFARPFFLAEGEPLSDDPYLAVSGTTTIGASRTIVPVRPVLI